MNSSEQFSVPLVPMEGMFMLGTSTSQFLPVPQRLLALELESVPFPFGGNRAQANPSEPK